MPDTVRIAMWSGPRNISTAMMRAWDSRSDCAVMDEPFYGAYLAATGLAHPMREEIMSSHPVDWDEIATDCQTRCDADVIYQKHMTQHMVPEATTDWMGSVRHAFLIRPPAEVATSFALKMKSLTPDDLGFRRQFELYEIAEAAMGTAPPVIEAGDVLRDPAGMLEALCDALGVSFQEAMLSWSPGRRESDGVWAAHWYGSVEKSTGFAPPQPADPAPDELAGVISECEPYYQAMAARKLGPAR